MPPESEKRIQFDGNALPPRRPLLTSPTTPPERNIAILPKSEQGQKFSRKVRDQVKQQQKEKCAYCGRFCRGHEREEPELTVHHVIPKAMGGDNARTNAVGLCADTCHPLFDSLAFNEGRFFFEVLMEEGKEYLPLRGHRR